MGTLDGPTAASRLRPDRRSAPPRVLALVGLPTGAALVVYFLSGISLPLALVGTVGGIGAVSIITWRRLHPDRRRTTARHGAVGLAVGIGALAVYDLSRFALVALLGSQANPWEALPHFGELLTGQPSSTVAASVAGFVFHTLNGLGFAVAYALLLGQRGPLAGVLWALGLEAATLTFYPGWLDIRAVGEFASISMAGHVCYGLVLGSGCRYLLSRGEL